MKTKLFLLALPGALALGLLASAQDVGTPGQPGAPATTAPRVKKPFTAKPVTTPVLPENKIQTPHGEAVNYCQSTLNSTGWFAMMGCAGDLSVCHNNTCLRALDVPAGVTGLFFYGGEPYSVPMANGYLCVSPFHPGLFRLPPVITDATKTAHLDIDFATMPSAGAILPGSTWYFQFWFRDSDGGGAGSNFSDGLRVRFCP